MNKDHAYYRRYLNQAYMDEQSCHIVDCLHKPITCSTCQDKCQPKNWWHELNRVPCFVCENNSLKNPIHPQSPYHTHPEPTLIMEIK